MRDSPRHALVMTSALTQHAIESDIPAALNEMSLTPAQLLASLEDCGCCFDLPTDIAGNAKDLWTFARSFIIELAQRDDIPTASSALDPVLNPRTTAC